MSAVELLSQSVRRLPRVAKVFAALIPFLMLVAAVSAFFIPQPSAERSPKLTVELDFGKVTKAQLRYVSRGNAREGDRLRFRATVLNRGSAPAHDLTMLLSTPSQSAGTYARGSCRIGRRGQEATPCDDDFYESTLYNKSIAPGQIVVVTFDFTVRRPPCTDFAASASLTVDSLEEAELGARVNVTVGGTGSGLPECGTPESDLMELTPLAFRGKCSVDNNSTNRPLAEIACVAPDPQVARAGYELFSNAARTEAVYEARLEHVDARLRRRCASDLDGEDVYHYDSTSRPRGRYLCWVSQDGESFIEWTDLRLHVYAYASRKDEGVRRLHGWFNNQAGPYSYTG